MFSLSFLIFPGVTPRYYRTHRKILLLVVPKSPPDVSLEKDGSIQRRNSKADATL
jgi:hypothetical protein